MLNYNQIKEAWDTALTHYYKNGEHHRLDGPAIICNKCPYKAWYVNGIRLSENKEDILNAWWNKNNKDPEIVYNEYGIYDCSCGRLYGKIIAY